MNRMKDMIDEYNKCITSPTIFDKLHDAKDVDELVYLMKNEPLSTYDVLLLRVRLFFSDIKWFFKIRYWKYFHPEKLDEPSWWVRKDN